MQQSFAKINTKQKNKTVLVGLDAVIELLGKLHIYFIPIDFADGLKIMNI